MANGRLLIVDIRHMRAYARDIESCGLKIAERRSLGIRSWYGLGPGAATRLVAAIKPWKTRNGCFSVRYLRGWAALVSKRSTSSRVRMLYCSVPKLARTDPAAWIGNEIVPSTFWPSFSISDRIITAAWSSKPSGFPVRRSGNGTR